MLEIVIISYVFFGSTLGTITLAANHILLQFVHISSYALDGFAFSAEALVGSSYGEKSPKKIRNAVIKSTMWAFLCACCAALFFFIFGKPIIDIMVKEALVTEESQNYLFWMAITPLTGFLSFMLDGIFIGATKTTYMRKAMIQSAIVYAISIAILFPQLENLGLWISINIFFIARAASLAKYYHHVEKVSL